LNQGLDGGVVMTLGGQTFNHRRGDVDSPYCDDDAACEEGDLCTRDLCTAGGCVHLPLNVDDLNPCTQDTCTSGFGPMHTSDPLCCLSNGACDDLQECTIDSCELNRCVHRGVFSCESSGDPTVRRVNRDN
ncbi:MAG TPA: hypothetical protein VGR38_12705, partial [Candidatus Polarisedimenticolia bacterium]|nr:hypothetical protein [Candidatus Polarisedimenticolia bacterium]